ncbi:hypothetical protein LCI18_001798 [Fusarium solani-melongenae]|uniref:Uncharacterized protein n=1 Tax=Fusarium solani subsp. cucurbitae TaxID=2747967 RepID=A0ACD3YPK8_FUSSC|nr:hypothetical protein LCI18_001798 [Fusarium solani-melongenae]
MDDSDGSQSSYEVPKDFLGRKLPYLRTIYFRFGTRIIGATGRVSDHCHPNVLRLQIHTTFLALAIQTLISLLPLVLVSRIQAKFPEWFLPERIVLKIERDNWKEEFDLEKTAYEKLKGLQGDVIPRCYGQIEYDGERALILSDVGEACLATPDGAVLDENDLRLLLDKAITSLTDRHVSQDDTKLNNFHLVTENGKDRIVVVDLEMVDMDLSEDGYAFAARSKVSWLIQQYLQHLDTMEYDG